MHTALSNLLSYFIVAAGESAVHQAVLKPNEVTCANIHINVHNGQRSRRRSRAWYCIYAGHAALEAKRQQAIARQAGQNRCEGAPTSGAQTLAKLGLLKRGTFFLPSSGFRPAVSAELNTT